jgi:hypothetical protein
MDETSRQEADYGVCFEVRLIHSFCRDKKALTSRALYSNDGELMAFGSADLCIHVLTVQFQVSIKLNFVCDSLN